MNKLCNSTELSNKLADALEKYLDGRIDNFELDDLVTVVKAKARRADVAYQIAHQVWYYYDDCVRHTCTSKFPLADPVKDAIIRWILLLRFLGSRYTKADVNVDLSHYLVIGESSSLDAPLEMNVFWPFKDSDSWRQFVVQHQLHASLRRRNGQPSGE